MKIVILKNNFKNGLSVVERAVSETSHLPVLKHVLLKTVNGRLQLAATNLEQAVTRFVSGKIIEEGGLTIPFGALYSIISNLNDEKINLETKNNNLVLKTDNYEAQIRGLSEDDFPIIPKLENRENFVEISAAVLKNSLNQVLPAARISEIRPELSGALFDFQVTLLKIAATDSFRLAEKNIPDSQFKTNFTQPFKIIIPLKTVQEILRVFSDKEMINIAVDASQILLKNDDVELISRLIDGNYPDYEPIIPKNFETDVLVDKAHLVSAIKLVSNFSGKVSDIKFKIQPNLKTLEVYSANQYLGENNYLIPAKVTGAAFEDISFNWHYLLDGLRVIERESLFFGVNGNVKPALFKATDDNSYFYILMPIKSV